MPPVVPDDSNPTDITPEEFELEVKRILEALGHRLESFVAEHDAKLSAPDGSYQIDVAARFRALGVSFVVLVECKHQRRAIEREQVQVLADKVRLLNAQKGILFATVGFQRGAIEYARANGIALIRVVPGELMYETRGTGVKAKPPPWVHLPKWIGLLTAEIDARRISMSFVSGEDTDALRNALFANAESNP